MSEINANNILDKMFEAMESTKNLPPPGPQPYIVSYEGFERCKKRLSKYPHLKKYKYDHTLIHYMAYMINDNAFKKFIDEYYKEKR